MKKYAQVTARLKKEIDTAESRLNYTARTEAGYTDKAEDAVKYLEWLLDTEELVHATQSDIRATYNRDRERKLIKNVRGY